MTIKRVAVLLACFTSLAVVACVGTGGGGSGGGTAVEVAGTITRAAGLDPVVNVTVTDVTSDKQFAATADGAYRAKATTTTYKGEERVVLRFEAPGYAPQIVTVPVKPKIREYRSNPKMYPLVLRSLTQNVPTTISSTTMGHSVSISFGGINRSGLTARYAVIDPAESPGMLRDASSGPDRALQSGAMLFFEIVDAVGSKVAPPADLRMSVGPYQIGDVPEAEPMQGFVLDEDAGMWADPQLAGTPATGMTFAAPTLPPWGGFLNADRRFRTACAKGKIVVTGSDGAACKGGRVKALGPPGIASFDSTGNEGTFCVTGAQGSNATISIGSASAIRALPNAAGSCGSPASCLDLGTITVTDTACGRGDCAGGCPPGQECLEGVCVSPNSCASRCCPGRDDSCMPGNASCYCDNYCVEAGDCCPDYGLSCG